MDRQKSNAVVVAVFLALNIVILELGVLLWKVFTLPVVRDSTVTSIVEKACQGQLDVIHRLSREIEERVLECSNESVGR